MKRDIAQLFEEAIQLHERAIELLSVDGPIEMEEFNELMKRRQELLDDMRDQCSPSPPPSDAYIQALAAQLNELEERFTSHVEDAMKHLRTELIRVKKTSQGARSYEKMRR